jgi:hypothetical protein
MEKEFKNFMFNNFPWMEAANNLVASDCSLIAGQKSLDKSVLIGLLSFKLFGSVISFY